MKKKTIWYISKYANIAKYGADTRQASFCKEFAKQGHEVKLITSNSSHLYKTLPQFKSRYLETPTDDFDVVWVNTIRYKKANSFKRILSWFWFEIFVILLPFIKKYKKPDVVIASSLSLLSVMSGLFFKIFYSSKFIIEVRDIWPQSLIDLKGVSANNPLILFLSFIEKLGYKYSDSIVGTMPGLALHVKSVIGDSNKVHFIPQGLNPNSYNGYDHKLSDAFIEKYIPKEKFLVTYAGSMGIANALSYIVTAAKLLAKENFNIHFLLVGDGAEKESLKNQAIGLQNITFVPKVSKNNVHHLLSISDLLVASVRNEKIYRYGISLNKFIDYMFAKKPIVCMFSGYQSMLNEANCGEFIPSENAEALVECILKYSCMPQSELNTLGENGYNFLVEKRNFQVLSEQYMALFDD